METMQEEALLIQMSQSRRIISGIGDMQSPLWEREDAFSCSGQEKGKTSASGRNIIWRETMTSPLEEPCGSSPTLSLARSRAGLILTRPLLRGAAVLPSWPSCCSPRVPSSPEQLVALAGCPTLEQDVSDLVCRDGSDAH